MHRTTRLLQPLTRSIRPSVSASTIPHAGPSNFSRRVLSTTQWKRPVGPFSATHRYPRSSRLAYQPIAQEDVEQLAEETDAAELEEASLEGAPVVEEVEVDEDAAGVSPEEGEVVLDKDVDAALLPFVKPKIPRDIRADEPIILPLSSFKSADPSKPDPAGVGISLPHDMFNARIRRDILHECALWWQARMRRGNIRTLGRSEVAFSSAKIRPQKKTGQARLGSRGSPMLRKGGHAHPLRPKDWSYPLNRKVRQMGVRMALSSKLYMNNLRIVQNLNDGQWKTTRQARRALTAGWRVDSEHWELYNDDAKGKRVPKTTEGEEDGFIEEAEDDLRDTVVEGTGRTIEPGSEEKESDAAAITETTSDALEETTSEALEETTSDDVEELKTVDPSEQDPNHPWIDSAGFGGKSDKLSILFLYPPSKPAAEIWDFARPLRNIPGVEIMSTDEVQVFHMLQYRWLIMEGGCVDALQKHVGQIKTKPKEFPEAEKALVESRRERKQRLAKGKEEAIKTEDTTAVGATTSPKAPKTSRAKEMGVSTESRVWPSVAEWKRGHYETTRPRRRTTYTRMPSDAKWILEKWRKIRGRKANKAVFGFKHTDEMQLRAKRSWKKIRLQGRYATVDRVAKEMSKMSIGEKTVTAHRAKPRKDLAKHRRRVKRRLRKELIHKHTKEDKK